jgi:hypothetical protein
MFAKGAEVSSANKKARRRRRLSLFPKKRFFLMSSDTEIPFYLLLFDEDFLEEQEAHSFSVITERRVDGDVDEIETDSGELPSQSNGAAQECSAYVLGSLLERSMNLVKGNGLTLFQSEVTNFFSL